MDPIARVLEIIPYSFPRPPRLRLKLTSFSLPSAMIVYSLIILTYFMVVSGIVYDVIVEPPRIGSTQDHATGVVRPVVFLSGRVNEQYIIEGLSSGFMFVLGGVHIVLMDLALDRNRAKSVKISFASAGITFVVIGYVMKNVGCPVLTSSKIEGEGGVPINLDLVDNLTEEVVKTGPEAAAKVEILVLKGDHAGHEGCNGKLQDFNKRIVTEMKGKKSILQARAVNTFPGTTIEPAKIESFVLKDRRIEY